MVLVYEAKIKTSIGTSSVFTYIIIMGISGSALPNPLIISAFDGPEGQLVDL